MKHRTIGKRLLILAVLLAMTAAAGCASSSPAPKAAEVEGPVSLSEEDFVFHGVHMRIPDAFVMERNGQDFASSVLNVKATNGTLPFINCFLTYNDETDTWDTALDKTYSPYSARIYFAEGGRATGDLDTWSQERTRMNGIDALILKHTESTGEGDRTLDCTRTNVILVLKRCAVEIDFTSYTEQFDRLFEECIDSIWVEESEIPELVKLTEPDALREAGLSVRAWEDSGLYFHVPDTYTLVEMDGRKIWISEDGDSFFALDEGPSTYLTMDRQEWEQVLQGLTGFQEVIHHSKGNFNGMYDSQVSYTRLKDGQLTRIDMVSVLPSKYDEEAVTISFFYPADDTETDELGTRMLKVLHYADGWKGEGLQDPEPVVPGGSETGQDG